MAGNLVSSQDFVKEIIILFVIN